MSTISPVTGEVSDSKVAAIFDSERTARRVAQQLQSERGFKASQVKVVTRHDRQPGRKLEPENRGILRTLIVAHYKLGLIGLAIGAVVFGVLYAAGITAVTNSPWFAAGLIVGYGGVFGLMFGGLVTLRPDHDPYLFKVREALAEGKAAVVVHAFDAAERDRAGEALAAASGETIRTL
ncbi:hypothetical protein [Luteimonas sp. FCS-9]|uniref:hypothetical protein n=1 Tax=Luteimonas sp. FCS-9 TaxID=1547516 RepID=UPI00063EB1D7|nr:hypothetical protein [Luteimonas sp. FCS-9]KLI98716.1 hypothetical protein WQ56_14380 [Luteimonas sp. FCS-9]